jgi:hypothetical protein
MNFADTKSKPLYLMDFRLSESEQRGAQKEEGVG